MIKIDYVGNSEDEPNNNDDSKNLKNIESPILHKSNRIKRTKSLFSETFTFKKNKLIKNFSTSLSLNDLKRDSIKRKQNDSMFDLNTNSKSGS